MKVWSRFTILSALCLLPSCSDGPSTEEIKPYLVSDAVFPEGCAVIYVERYDIAQAPNPDYRAIYQVTASDECVGQWRFALDRDADFQCSPDVMVCERMVMDVDSGYREERARVRFLGGKLVQLEVTKL